MVKPIPDDYPRVTPYLFIDGASAAIDFYCSVLGARERMRMPVQTAQFFTPSLSLAIRSSCWATRTRTWTCEGPGPSAAPR